MVPLATCFLRLDEPFRVLKPTDPPEWETSLRALARLRDEGVLTDAEFEAKKSELLDRA